jgi:hypothetical protein
MCTFRLWERFFETLVKKGNLFLHRSPFFIQLLEELLMKAVAMLPPSALLAPFVTE